MTDGGGGAAAAALRELAVLRLRDLAVAASSSTLDDTARNAMVRAVFPLEPPQMAHFRAFLLHEVPGLVWFNAQARELGLSRTAMPEVSK